MIAALPNQRTTLALGVAAFGLGAAWLTQTASGLLLPIAVLFLFVDGRSARHLVAILAVASAAAVVVAGLDLDGTRPLAASIAAFLASAACLGALITAIAPTALMAGSSRAGMAGSAASEFQSLIHPEDRAAAAQAAARAFWNGIPQVVSIRKLQPDGSYRATAFRAEPGYGVPVAVEAMVQRPDEPWTTSASLGETGAAVEAAKVIEQLHGAAFAFDAAGIFTYATPVAQTSIAMTLDDLNRPLDGRPFIEGGDLGWKLGVHPDDYGPAAARLRTCLRTGEDFNWEYRVLRATGDYVWHRFAIRPTHAEDGRITGWYGIGIDIDVYKRTEAALRDSERQLRLIIDSVPALLWTAATDGTPTYINRQFAETTGVALSDMIEQVGTTSFAFVHPDHRAAAEQAFRRSTETGEPYVATYRQIRADGSFRWTETRAEALRDDKGAIIQWYGVSVDIDDLVNAQEALHNRERELSQLVDMVPVQIRRLTPEGEPVFFNKRLIDFFGVDVGDLDKPGMTRLASIIGTLVHPDDAARLLATVRHSLGTGEPYAMRYRMRRHDGVYRWVDGRAEPLRDQSGAILQWYVISIDIDDEMRAQEALRERERELSHLVDLVPSFIWRLGPGGEPNFFNSRLIDYLGDGAVRAVASGGSGLADIMQDAVHPDDAAELAAALAHSLATGEPFSTRCRVRRFDGVYRWTEGRAEALRDDSGAIIQWYGVSVDIDDLVTAQEALRERERSLAQLVETLPAMIDCATPEGEPIFRSQQLSDFLGYRLEELDAAGIPRLEGTLDAGVHPDDIAGVRESYVYSLTTGEPYAHKHRLRRFDGDYRWVETRAAAMRDPEGGIIQWNIICLDIEKEVRAQEELRLAQERLARAGQAASLSELSASIAHEVNQPLAAIVANSHACHRWLTLDPPNLERAKATAGYIVHDANAAAEVVGRIRALFRQSTDARRPTSLADVLSEARSLVTGEAVRRRVRLDFDIAGDLPRVALDRIQIQQVLVNLIRNGMEAMEDAAGERAITVRARRMDETVRIEIADRGPGVGAPDRIFEPFFTTKDTGMGMGLAICRSIVEAHGGRLWVENGEPVGATFVFTLPLHAKAPA